MMWEGIANWISGHWEAGLAAAIGALALLSGAVWVKRLSDVVAVARAAYAEAERRGIIDEIKGARKAAPFLEAFFAIWEEMLGEQPTPVEQGVAMLTAAREAKAHKGPDLGKSAPPSPEKTAS